MQAATDFTQDSPTKQFNIKPIISALDSFEEIALNLAARIGPWLIPVLPAYTVGTALYKHLHTWPAVAIIGATAFELAGIAATKTALRAWVWNNARRKTDPAAPFGLAIVLSILYFIVGIGLSVALEVWPGLVKIAPASFFLLAGQSYFVLAISHNLAQWENDRRHEKIERSTINELTTENGRLTKAVETLTESNSELTKEVEALRQKIDNMMLTNAHLSPESNGILDNANTVKLTKRQERLTKALTLFNQGLSPAEVADNLNVSERTAIRYQTELNGQVTK